MLRIIAIAAVAALVAAPASAQSMRVSTAGKTPEQLHADIVKAAKSVCTRATFGASFPREMYRSCVSASVAAAVAKSGDPALAAVPTRLASR